MPVRRGAFADAEAAANGAYLTHVVDVNDEDFARDERFFKWDKLHFTPEGHRRLASVPRRSSPTCTRAHHRAYRVRISSAQ